MQRDLFDKKALTLFFLYLFIVLYPTAQTLYPLLPPMLGLAYVKWREAVRAKSLPHIAVWMIYALVFETMWGLPLYGVWSVMIFTFVLFDNKITHTLHMDPMIKVLSAIIFDLLYFSFLYGYGVLMGEKVIDTAGVLFYYFFMDILGVMLF